MALLTTSAPTGTKTILAFAIVLLVGGVAITALGINEYQSQTEALDNAVEVEATIVTSEVQLYESEFDIADRDRINRDRTHRTTDTPEYRLVIEFEYEFAGEQHRSSNIDVAGSVERFDSHSDAQEARAKYPEGSQTTAYVNPGEPGEAFLEDELPLGTYLIPGFGGFVLFASVVLWGVFVFRIVSMPFKLVLLE